MNPKRRDYESKYAQTLSPGYRFNCTAKCRISGHPPLSARSGIPGRCYWLFDLTGTISCTGGARIPTGLAYRAARARLLIVLALLIVSLCDFLYTFAAHPVIFALIHSVNGFALGAATTLYLAFFVEALPEDENRHHAMGIYMGCLAVGHSSGSFLAGAIADRLGYPATFQTAAFLALLCAAVLAIFRRKPDSLDHQENKPDSPAFMGLRNSLRAVAEPEMASVVMVPEPSAPDG